MSNMRLVGISAVVLAFVCGIVASAEDVSTKKLFIKDHADPTKRQIQVLSKDVGVQLSEADDPATNGATVHVYSATDAHCAILEPGANWVNKPTNWKYKNKTTKNSAQVKDGKLLIKLKAAVAPIAFTLNEPTQGTVNAQVQFGTGTKYCMKCSGNKKDEPLKFLGKDCVLATCDAEPPDCPPSTTTTTTTTSTTTTTDPGATTTTTTTTTSTTTTTAPAGIVLKGALTATPGKFNYNATLGLPGANAACNSNFPGTHACTYAELQSAQTAGDLDGLKDIGNNTVTSFWAIDGTQPPLQQCNDSLAIPPNNLNWQYGTADTMSRGQKVALNNPAGTLGSLQSSIQCNFLPHNWVGCCQ